MRFNNRAKIFMSVVLLGIAGVSIAHAGRLAKRGRPADQWARSEITVKGSRPVHPLAARVVAFNAEGVPTTVVEPDPNAAGDTLTLEQQIADRFAFQNPQPAGRSAHFQWLSQHAVTLTGWRGLITTLSANDDGSWNVTLNFTADISATDEAGPVTPDYYIETYNYSATGQLTFLNGVDPVDSAPDTLDYF